MHIKHLSEKGNLALAMAVVIIAFLSSVTMTGIALKDAVTARMQYDGLQETHLLRYQSYRGVLACRATDYSGEGFLLPSQQFEIASTDARTTYIMKTKIVKANVTTGGGFYSTNGYIVQTLVSAKRGGGSNVVWLKNDSPVRKYAEKDIRRSTFAGYHYFSDTDESENAGFQGDNGRVYFGGQDVIYGKVHSNTDIWVVNTSAGNNGGWPTFWGDVSTSGIFQSYDGYVPYQTIFKSHYYEHSPQLEFPPQASDIQGGLQFDYPEDPSVIVRVKVRGSSCSSWIGHIQQAVERESIDCYATYPPPTGSELFWYYLNKIDTVWTEGPSPSVVGNSIYCKNKTWIDGIFQGKQTWGCKDTLFLVGNIQLTGTPLGVSPDGGSNPSSANRSDFVGLVSEQRIYIKYGFKDPADSLRHHNNCGSDAQGIWIYAALCALGDGHGNPRKDGIFTFEYQAPHFSTPDLRLGNTVYTKIDLHKHRFPPTYGSPWPENLDFPWYNPLWPEPYPYTERGTIHLYGSVAQRRRGIVHRGTWGDVNHGAWYLEHSVWGGTSTGQNYPGATGTGIGYKKDYHFDNRFSFTQPPNFPEVHTRAGLTPFDSESWKFKKPPVNF